MKCPYCGNDARIKDNVLIYVDSYGQRALAKTECCNRGLTIVPVRSYELHVYHGTRRKDDWGRPIESADTFVNSR